MNLSFLTSSSSPNLSFNSYSPHQVSRIPQTKCKSKHYRVITAYSTIRSCCILQKNNQLRRSANYHPTVWDHTLIESLASPYTHQRFNNYLQNLKTQVISSLESAAKLPVVQLQLIDAMQRLGVAYHFQEEIKQVLHLTYIAHNNIDWDDDVYATALRFRILRQNHYPLHSGVFRKFIDGAGRLVEHLNQDAKGLLSLYEASHLLVHGDDVLEETMTNTFTNLKSLNGLTISRGAMEVQQTPLHWRMQRLEARNFINLYEKYENKDLVLLELAKLDFNLVQSVHQKDLIELSRWWRQLGLGETLHFARDRLVENFIWAIGIAYEPQYSKCRIGLTKFICILTAIDDIYDVYGSLEELELFTKAVSRWDINVIDELPKYMKICYLAMFNFANEVCYNILKDQGIDVLPYVVKEWESLCKSYLVEARWFNSKYTPRLNEFLETAWTSVGGPAAMVHSYILSGETLTTATLDCLKHGPELVYWASLITRLNDDLGTSEAEMMRGDVPKSIQCYMEETNVTEEEAREHIRELIRCSWKRLNKECVESSLPKSIVSMSLNMARTGQSIFEHGDGIGTSDGVTKDRAVSLFIQPIQINAT